MVRKLAMRIRAQLELNSDLDELIAYGFRGLMEARQRFDPTRGVLFSTFAHYRVRGAILDGVRTMAYLPRRIHHRRRAAEALDQTAESAAFVRGSEPSVRSDMAATLNAIDDVLSKCCAAFIVSAVGQGAEDAPPGAEDMLLENEARGRVNAALDLLPERERAVIEGYYFENRTIDELGAALGVSKSWASRLHTRALGMLRDALERADE